MNGFVLHVKRHEIKVALNGICIEKALSDDREGETIMSALAALINLVKHGLMVLSKECIPLNKAVLELHLLVSYSVCRLKISFLLRILQLTIINEYI